MAVNYRTSLKTTRMNAVKTDIDSGGAAGYVEICSAAYASVLATIPLAYNPCGTVSGDTLTFTMPQSDSSADATGTAAVARIKNSAGTVIIDGLTVTATGGGGNIQLNTVSITSGDIVQLTSATIQHAA
jgi:hypothetical protein